MESWHELIEDSSGEVSTLKVTILAVAAIHVIALVSDTTRTSHRPSLPLSPEPCARERVPLLDESCTLVP